METEKNRKIAEWLEPNPARLQKYDSNGLPIITFVSNQRCWWLDGPGNTDWHPVDFYTSEAANALVLEAMREEDSGHADLILRELFDELRRTRVDRKEAVCEAFIKWKEAL